MLSRSSRLLQGQTLSLLLIAVIVSLVALLYATDRRLGLYQFASTRCRFHAIPVAMSVLYHGRQHDYTANRSLAMAFQNTERNLDDLIREAVRFREETPGTYFWVADDRGLADYVIGAFKLFGPRTRSLSKFYFVLLGGMLTLFIAGYRRSPAVLLLPTFVLLGWLALAQVMLYPTPFQNGQGQWAEQISLYESRMFDVPALIAVLHLGVLAAGPSVTRAAWITAVPQAAFLVFLYHARSSLGWQYLGLFTLITVRIGWLALAQARSGNVARIDMLRPLFVAGLLGGSIAGLNQYQRVVYYPDYLSEHGHRTFWHNALMGLAYHPGLREELGVPLCDDRVAAEFVLRKMRERNPNLDRSRWNEDAALNSLGNHTAFDWNGYEAAAREFYLELWRDRPLAMAACYGLYKPMVTVSLAVGLAERIALVTWAGRGWEFLAGLGLVVAAAIGVAATARYDPTVRANLPAVAGVAAALVPFSLIPGIAFYPAITTTACFYLLTGSVGGGLAVRLASGWRVTT